MAAPQDVMGVVPSTNSTCPVGVPAPGLKTVTLAVNVTGWPTTDGLVEDDSVVVVAAGLTAWVSGTEVAGPLKLASPR